MEDIATVYFFYSMIRERQLCVHLDLFENVSMWLKLGAGTCLPGLVAAKVGADVTLTDDSKRVEVGEFSFTLNRVVCCHISLYDSLVHDIFPCFILFLSFSQHCGGDYCDAGAGQH